MTVVNGKIVGIGGGRPHSAAVHIALVDQSGQIVAGFVEDTELIGQASVIVDADGTWTADLTPTGTIESPMGPTLYRVQERAAVGAGTVYYISVPTSDDPVWVGDLRVTLPGSATEQLMGYLPLSGGQMTGPLILEDGSEAGSGGGGGGGGTPSSTVVSGTSYGQAAAAGAATTYARGDHTHGTVALPTPGALGAATSGHTHAGTYDPAGTAAAAVAAHQADTTAVHGIADTSALETSAGATSKVSAHAVASDPHGDRAAAAGALSAHEADTTAVHGIADTSALETSAGAASKVSTHAAAVDPHGDRAFTTTAIATHAGASDPHGDRAYTDTAVAGRQLRSTLTTKGDLYVATGSGAVSRVGVGSNDQVLTADSAQASGVKWATPSGGGGGGTVDSPAFPLSGYGLLAASGDPMGFIGANGGIPSGQVSMARVWIPAGAVITNLWIAVRTAGTYSVSAVPNRLGVYDDSGTQIDVTANDSTLFAATGWRGGPIGSPVAAGVGRFVYVAVLVGGFTGHAVAFPTGPDDTQTSWFSVPAGGGKRRGMYDSGNSALPATFNPVSFGTPTTFIPLLGVS